MWNICLRYRPLSLQQRNTGRYPSRGRSRPHRRVSGDYFRSADVYISDSSGSLCRVGKGGQARETSGIKGWNRGMFDLMTGAAVFGRQA